MKASLEEYMVPNTDQADHERTQVYQSIVGSLMYLAVNTRPDIAYAVSVLSRFLTNPSEKHVAAGIHVLQYLKGTTYLAIVLGGRDHVISSPVQM
jgi:hypothetical protein